MSEQESRRETEEPEPETRLPEEPAPDRQAPVKSQPADRIPQPDRNRLRLMNFGMSFVYWGAAVIAVLVSITVLTNLGSGDKPDSEYLAVAGGAFLFGVLLAFLGLRTYRGITDRSPPDEE